jgi:hypothetical protein
MLEQRPISETWELTVPSLLHKVEKVPNGRMRSLYYCSAGPAVTSLKIILRLAQSGKHFHITRRLQPKCGPYFW